MKQKTELLSSRTFAMVVGVCLLAECVVLSVLLLPDRGGDPGSLSEPGYAVMDPTYVPTYFPWSDTIVVEYTYGGGYAIGYSIADHPRMWDTFSLRADGTVIFQPAKSHARERARVPTSVAREIQLLLASPDWDSLEAYYSDPPDCDEDDRDCGYQQWHLITAGGKRVQTDGSGPPILAAMIGRLGKLMSLYYDARERGEVTPVPPLRTTPTVHDP